MRRKSSLTIIFLTVFIDLMGFGILIPILPTFASKNLDISDFGIGVIVAAYSLMQFVFNPILGSFSDKYGRKPFIVGSLLLNSLSYIIFSFSTTFFILLASRLLAGIGGSNIAVAQAYIADITPREERSKGMGLIGAAFGLGFVFGPMIGGFLSEYGYATAGFASAAFSFLAFLFASFILPESNLERKSKALIKYRFFDIKGVTKVIKSPDLGISVLIYFIIVFSMANIYGTFALLGYKVYNMSDREIGYLFGLIGLIGAIIQGGFIKRLNQKFSDKTLVTFGTFFMMIGLTFLPYGKNFTGVAIVAFALAIGTAVLQPVILAMVSKFSPDNEQGTILGINQSLASFARVLGPLWGGFAFNYLGYEFPFLTGGLFTFITLMIVIFVLKNKPGKLVENV